MIKGIIFDYGGTIDSRGVHWSEILFDAWQSAGVIADKTAFREAYVFAERQLARVRHILPHHTFRDVIRIKADIELQWLAQHNGFPPQDIAPSAEKIADFCDKVAADAVNEAKPTLQALAQRYPLVLVSNFYGNIDTVLSHYGIRDLFRQVIESAKVGVRKPSPEIFRLGVDALNYTDTADTNTVDTADAGTAGTADITPAETLVVGDSISKDIIPALQLGCHAVWLRGDGWEGDRQSLEQSLPDGVFAIDTLSQLPSLIPNI